MPEDTLDLAVIIGSTREGRFGDKVARWFAAEAEKSGAFRIDLIDLAAFDLPAAHPEQPTPTIERLRARLFAADAFVIVTPE
jgi:NAD(P)H-dependent FMN reductase